MHNLGRPPRRLTLLHLDGSENRLPAVGCRAESGEKVGRLRRHLRPPPRARARSRWRWSSATCRSTRQLEVDGLPAAQEVVVDPEVGLHVPSLTSQRGSARAYWTWVWVCAEAEAGVRRDRGGVVGLDVEDDLGAWRPPVRRARRGGRARPAVSAPAQTPALGGRVDRDDVHLAELGRSAAWSSGSRAARRPRRRPAAPPGRTTARPSARRGSPASIDPCSGWWAKAAAFTRRHLVGVGVAVAADRHARRPRGTSHRRRRALASPRARRTAANPSRSAMPRGSRVVGVRPRRDVVAAPRRAQPGRAPYRRRRPRASGDTARSRPWPRSSANPSSASSHSDAPSRPRCASAIRAGLVQRVDAVGGLGLARRTACDDRQRGLGPVGTDADDAQRRCSAAVVSAGSSRRRAPPSRRQHEPVADVADGADQRLVLRPELGAQPPDVDVDGAGAAEVVVAPDLLQQLVAGEDPAGVLGEVLEQLELLERQVERALPDLGGVRRVVDHDLAGPDHVVVAPRRRRARRAAGRSRAGSGPRARRARRCAARRRPCPSRGRRRPGRPRSPRAAPGSRCRWCAAGGTGRGRGRAPGGRRPGSGRRRAPRARALPSAGRILTWWPSRASAGRTSALGWSALVSSSRVLMAAAPPRAWTRCVRISGMSTDARAGR